MFMLYHPSNVKLKAVPASRDSTRPSSRSFMRCSMAPQVGAMHTGEVQYDKQQDKADGVNAHYAQPA